MDYLELIAVPVIVTAVVGILALIKNAVGEQHKLLNFFPLIGVGIGVLLAIGAFFIAPDLIPAGSAATAIKLGIASGLAATGTHQAYKQLTGKKQEGKGEAVAEPPKEDTDNIMKDE